MITIEICETVFKLIWYLFLVCNISQQGAQSLWYGESADPPYLLSGSPQAPNQLWKCPRSKRTLQCWFVLLMHILFPRWWFDRRIWALCLVPLTKTRCKFTHFYRVQRKNWQKYVTRSCKLPIFPAVDVRKWWKYLEVSRLLQIFYGICSVHLGTKKREQSTSLTFLRYWG